MKMKSFTLLGAVILTATQAFGQPKVDPRDYRELDDKQLAHLRFIANMADQKFNDWSKMDSSEPGQTADDSYRYQLAMMSYESRQLLLHTGLSRSLSTCLGAADRKDDALRCLELLG